MELMTIEKTPTTNTTTAAGQEAVR